MSSEKHISQSENVNQTNNSSFLKGIQPAKKRILFIIKSERNQRYGILCLSAFLKPWDHLAGSFIVQQAGGYARMLDGSEYSPNMRQGHLLTANSKSNWMYIRDKLVAIL